MKFLNLDTGYSFDGLWTNEQQKGYTFWFPGEQSTGITYTMPICILTETDEPLQLSIEENDVFSFVAHGTETTVDGYKFNDVIYSNQFTTEPENIGNYYGHVFNVGCNSKNTGEYICRINIGNEGFIRVGADLYGEYEPVYVNLSNMGVELPDNIQKAIYDSDVHEDVKDNILMNRKFKELLSNYWNIVANKGSQKSLKHSIDWFEWGDILNIREINRRTVANKTLFSDNEISTIINNFAEEMFTHFLKTSYVSLYCSMQKELDEYDEELNPILEQRVLKWSREDLQLKLALLANFFGIYFMPIHISIMHAAVEDEVFTNTIKSITGTESKRFDAFGDLGFVECNVKDNSIYRMTNVKVQATNDTVYAIKDYSDSFFGVDKFPKYIYNYGNDSINVFASQYYSGPGVVIPFKFTLLKQDSKDFVRETIVDYIDDYGHNCKLHFYDTFITSKNKIEINFNLLVKTPNDYSYIFTFLLASGKTLTRKVDFKVILSDNININVYKIKSKNDTNGLTVEDFYSRQMNKYFYRIQPNNSDNQISYYTQYLPYITPDSSLYSNYTGLKLNQTVVVKINLQSGVEELKNSMKERFLEFSKRYNDDITYITFICKRFFESLTLDELNSRIGNTGEIIRNDMVFYPQFHYLEKIEGNRIEDYTIYQHEAICCAAEINDGKTIKDFKYGNILRDTEWTFSNFNEVVEFPTSSAQPFIAKTTNNLLSPGYYDISFKYTLINGVVTECTSNSAFRIKTLP